MPATHSVFENSKLYLLASICCLVVVCPLSHLHGEVVLTVDINHIDLSEGPWGGREGRRRGGRVGGQEMERERKGERERGGGGR